MPNAFLNKLIYVMSLLSLFSTFTQVSCISIGLVTGSNACSSRVFALPSQLNDVFQPKFINALAFLDPSILSTPVLNLVLFVNELVLI